MNPEKFDEINKDTVKAEEMMSPEEKEMSRSRERSALWDEIEKRAEREIEEMRPGIKSKMEGIVREDVLNDRMVNSVLHEYKKLRELYLGSAVLSDNSSYSNAHRGLEALRAFGMDSYLSLVPVSTEEIESVKNTVDVDRYFKILTANLNFIDSVSSGDNERIEGALKQIEILDPKTIENYRERLPVIRAMLDKWMNGEIYLEGSLSNRSPRGFNDATPEEKLKFIKRVAERECFNFTTGPGDDEKYYCMSCGRIPGGFGVNWTD